MEENNKTFESKDANAELNAEQRDFNFDDKTLFRKLPLRARFMRWWLTTFRNKTIWKGDVGGFNFRLRRYWLDIRSIAKNHWNMRLGVNEHAHGYFTYIVAQMRQAESTGDKATMEAMKQHFSFFATNLNLTSTFILTDKKFTSGILREINWSVSRIMKKASEEVKSTTKAETDTDEAFMQSSVERGQMNRQQRRKAQRDERKAMRKAFKDDPLLKGMVNGNTEVSE